MEELFEDKQFQKKMARIPPHLRETFMATMQKMCNKESEILLDFLGQSRNDMSRQGNAIGEEQDKLKSHAIDLEEKRKAADAKAMSEYMNKRNGKNHLGDLSNPDVKNTPLMELYFRQKARRKARSRGEMVSDSDEEFDVTDSRMSSVQSTQSIPTPLVVKTIEELRDELFQNLDTADAKMQEERQRQTELLDFLKDVKSKKKTDKAQALLSEATQSEKAIADSKEKQDRKVKEKLEEKKKRKHRHRGSKKRKSVISIQGDVGGLADNGVDDMKGPESEKQHVSKKERRRRRMSTQQQQINLQQLDTTSDMLNDDLRIVDETNI